MKWQMSKLRLLCVLVGFIVVPAVLYDETHPTHTAFPLTENLIQHAREAHRRYTTLGAYKTLVIPASKDSRPVDLQAPRFKDSPRQSFETLEVSVLNEESPPVCNGVGIWVNDTNCQCPMDYAGDQCQHQREIACSAKLQVQCNDYKNLGTQLLDEWNPKLINGKQQPCWINTTDTIIPATVSVECSFADMSWLEAVIRNPNWNNASFQYSVLNRSRNIAFSIGNEKIIGLFTKIFNLNHLSDETYRSIWPIDPEKQLEHGFPLEIILNLSSVKSNFFVFGKRLYLEYGIRSTDCHNVSLSDDVVGRYWLNFANLQYETESRNVSKNQFKGQNTVLGLILGVVVAIMFRNK